MACQLSAARVLRRLKNITVEPVLLLFMFASYLTFTAFMAMTYDKSCLADYNQTFCDDLNADRSFAQSHQAEEDTVQNSASTWMMLGNIALTVPATVVLLFCLGTLGDRKGRRLPLVVPCMAAVAYSTSNIVNAVYMSSDPGYTLLGPIFSGLGGGYLGVLAGSYTYLTHRANSNQRMAAVGIAEAVVYFSGTVSVFVSGKLVHVLGYMNTFVIPLACQVLALLYIWLLLPEVKTKGPTSGTTITVTATTITTTATTTTTTATTTTTTTAATKDDSTSENPAGYSQESCLNPLREMWKFVTTPRPRRVKVHLALFVVVLDVLQLVTTGENDILLLYLKRQPRSWSYTKYGYFKGAENFTRGAAVLVLLPLLKKKMALRDTTLILAGLVSKMAGLILLGIAKDTWMIFLVVGVACLQGFPSAGLRSLMASLVQEDEQGRLFGLVAATESVISLAATLMFNGVYPLTLTVYDGLCFQLAAFLVFICLAISLYLHRAFYTTDKYTVTELPEETSTVNDPNISSQIFANQVAHIIQRI